MTGSKYVVCDKCGVRHSTLVRHKCFKPEDQKEKPKFDDPKDEGEDGKGQGEGGGNGDQSGDDQSDGQDQGDGENQSKGQGQGDGQSDDEGEGEGEAEAEAQVPPPPPPPPVDEPPPAAVIVTVLKYAALTGKGRDFLLRIEVEEEGLMFRGFRGERTATALLPWPEFEKRSTIDGEMLVVDVIDEVQEKLDGKKMAREELLWIEPIEFVTGYEAHLWETKNGMRIVGVPVAQGNWEDLDEHPHLAEVATLMEGVDTKTGTEGTDGAVDASAYMVAVDEAGYSLFGKRKRIVRNVGHNAEATDEPVETAEWDPEWGRIGEDHDD